MQQNLKSDDSYIYLSAINGLSALADVFPDTVLNILCEEYSDTTKQTGDDGHEVRMKLGESLVRVTKILGKYVTTPVFPTLDISYHGPSHTSRGKELSGLSWRHNS